MRIIKTVKPVLRDHPWGHSKTGCLRQGTLSTGSFALYFVSRCHKEVAANKLISLTWVFCNNLVKIHLVVIAILSFHVLCYF